MSEKRRFEITEYGSDYYIEIIDNEKKLDESIPNPSQKLGLVECADLLNEQERMINILQKQIDLYEYQLKVQDRIIDEYEKNEV